MTPNDSPTRSHRRWTAVFGVAALALVLAVSGTVVAIDRGWLGDTDVKVSPAAPGAPILTAEERAYYEYVTPRLRELAAQARALARLGEEKSRDLFEIQARGARLDELVDEIADFGRTHGIPARFATVGAGFAEGARLTRQAMEESRRGFATFDWDRVAAVVPVFLDGADRLDQAAAELERLGGAATPVAAMRSLAPRKRLMRTGAVADGRLLVKAGV